MLENKLLQKLLIINGLLFPIILIFMLFSFIKSEFFKGNKYNESTYIEEGDGMIVGKKLKEANDKKVALQGIYFYQNAEEIFNSENYYLQLSINIYEEAKQFESAASSAGDINLFAFLNTCNILFLDKEHRFLSLLLNKKASIREMHIQRSYIKVDDEKEIPDSTMQNIVYQIGFEDTNKDDVLDKQDAHDLFISDLAGKNLIQVTQNIDIEDFRFQKNHSELFITYKDRSNEREEYKRKKFAIYNIKTNTLKKLTDIDKALDEFEKIIRQ